MDSLYGQVSTPMCAYIHYYTCVKITIRNMRYALTHCGSGLGLIMVEHLVSSIEQRKRLSVCLCVAQMIIDYRRDPLSR